MKRKWLTVAATMLLGALVISMSMTPALAQTKQEEEMVQPAPKHLKIRAPKVAQPNQDITMTVYERPIFNTSAEVAPVPVTGANMWAISESDFTVLRETIATAISNKNTSLADFDFETITANLGATYLGQTDNSGNLTYSFSQQEKYFLIALKDGYRPGIAPLVIKERPSALSIRVPRMVSPGEEMTMTIADRQQHAPVSQANVWAISRDTAISLLKKGLESAVPATDALNNMGDYEESLRNLGAIWLGTSDQNGQLNYTFEQGGKYFLIATRNGYIPGFVPLTVKERGNKQTDKLRNGFQQNEGGAESGKATSKNRNKQTLATEFQDQH